ncbi:pyridoxamine 5'-phosphate oxidase family protein [Cellvibrio sp. KY-GH-1]|uniref:pyridoxamine 5'-phosphate oxidase family protein n=1 Tax=Cellvibrio sp. KY-GH-1 TaxID=2303332 RepID=UPI0012470F33|nr:pyridoxamine 5'-phosphate oxidase family protein [Cellvibrio sp. KY-GH-1]QEY15714.1 pyridoxamine 5'-phosphate oxidase family protein [Cellvibrio sp. KY-GH-1]
MNQSQELFGTPSEKAATKVRPYMVDWVQSFIKNSPFMVMATSNYNGDCDASPKGGLPGFVKVISEKLLLIPDVAGNKLFQSYENFETNSKVGLIFFIPGVNSSARVNGSIRILRKSDPEFEKIALEVYNPDEKAKILQAILVDVHESYSQCPRALAFSKLWSTETIIANIEDPPIENWVAGT